MVSFTVTWLEPIFRWLHIIAGIMWIGHLWFFNFVNAQVAKSYDADSKKKVIPELMPRALYWFRWGAAYTWIFGILLLGTVYYMQANAMLLDDNHKDLGAGAATGIGLGLLVVGFLVYDILWKQLAKKEALGAGISFALTVGIAFGLSMIFSERGMLIHIGALFGTIMAGNVWMRIWPNQRRIIAAIKEGKAPDAAWAGMAGLRSKHNTYMSVPLMFFMISQHGVVELGMGSLNYPWLGAALVIAAGWGLTKFFFVKSASDAPKFF